MLRGIYDLSSYMIPPIKVAGYRFAQLEGTGKVRPKVGAAIITFLAVSG